MSTQTASWSGRTVTSSPIPNRHVRSSMSDSRLVKFADVLVGFCTEVREGDLVTLESSPRAAPLVRELYRSVLEAGGYPLPRISLEGTDESLLTLGSDEQLDWVNPTRVEAVADYLATKRELRIVADGTDLRLSTEGRTWISSKGRENFPDGEVFTGPVETSVEGQIRFSYPAIFNGREVEDVRLRFEGGEVVEATATRGQEFLREMIAMDDGARGVGEFAFGLNDAITTFTRDKLYDDKIGGTVHLALGTAYPETGGLNRSALHWDMVCDLRSGSEVYADGEVVYRDGRFLNGVG